VIDMQVAFFKGTKTGLAGIYNRGVRFVTKGKYSHCELIFSNGISASASFMDGGVRFKKIAYDESHWDILDICDIGEGNAYAWFKDHEGQGYDLLGNLHFLFGFVGDNRHKWSCAEAVAEAIGVPDGWRINPNSLYPIVKKYFAVK
jgi:hypothetical protein